MARRRHLAIARLGLGSSLLSWLVPACAAAAASSRAPELAYDDTILTPSARTVDFNGRAVVPRTSVFRRGRGGRRLDVVAARTKLVVGLARDATASVTVTQTAKRLRVPGGPVRRAAGRGDLALGGKYRFLQRSGRAETTEASLLAGLALPTGEHDLAEAGLRLPAALQPGSGAVDANLGVAFTRIRGRWLVNAAARAFEQLSGGRRHRGTRLALDLGSQFRLIPARYARFDQQTLNLVAELNALLEARAREQGVRLADSGGVELLGAAGLQWILGERLLVEGAWRFPLYVDLNGDRLRPRGGFVLGLRARF